MQIIIILLINFFFIVLSIIGIIFIYYLVFPSNFKLLFSDHETDLKNAYEEFNNLKTDSKGLVDKVSNNEINISNINDNILDINNKIVNFYKIPELDQKIKNNLSTINTLNNDMKTSKDDIASLQSNMTDLKTDTISLKDGINSNISNLVSLSTLINYLDSNIKNGDYIMDRLYISCDNLYSKYTGSILLTINNYRPSLFKNNNYIDISNNYLFPNNTLKDLTINHNLNIKEISDKSIKFNVGLNTLYVYNDSADIPSSIEVDSFSFVKTNSNGDTPLKDFNGKTLAIMYNSGFRNKIIQLYDKFLNCMVYVLEYL